MSGLGVPHESSSKEFVRSTDPSSGPVTSTPEDRRSLLSIYRVAERDLSLANEQLETMDQWFPTRIHNIFGRAKEFKDVITIMTGRQIHPDDLTTLIIMSERLKVMPSALIFLIVNFEEKKLRRFHMSDYE